MAHDDNHQTGPKLCPNCVRRRQSISSSLTNYYYPKRLANISAQRQPEEEFEISRSCWNCRNELGGERRQANKLRCEQDTNYGKQIGRHEHDEGGDKQISDTSEPAAAAEQSVGVEHSTKSFVPFEVFSGGCHLEEGLAKEQTCKYSSDRSKTLETIREQSKQSVELYIEEQQVVAEASPPVEEKVCANIGQESQTENSELDASRSKWHQLTRKIWRASKIVDNLKSRLAAANAYNNSLFAATDSAQGAGRDLEEPELLCSRKLRSAEIQM